MIKFIFSFFSNVRIAFVSFENESDCAAALTAHTQIAGEKVNVSYSYSPAVKQEQQAKPTPTNPENTKKKQPTKPGWYKTLFLSLIYVLFSQLEKKLRRMQFMSVNYLRKSKNLI